MMSEDSSMRSSFEHQLMEAKNRAELFSKSLQDAREQEAIALRILEEERSRWTQSFEEKSIMIEQLERELTSTVEALDYRNNNKDIATSSSPLKIPLSSDIKLFTNEEIDKTLSYIANEVHYQLPVGNDHKSNITSYVDIQQVDSPLRKKLLSIPIHTRSNQDAMLSTNLNSFNMQQPIMKYNDEDSSLWRDLLNQYKDQIKKMKIELDQITFDKEHCEEQIKTLNENLFKAKDEREQYHIALQNAEGKLQFRISQVIEYEKEKDVLVNRLKVSSNHIEELTQQIEILKHELTVANTELRVYTTRTTSLEIKLSEMISNRENHQGSITVQLKSTENQVKDLYKQLKEVHQSYSIQLEESKRTAINMQMIMKDIETKCEEFQIRALSAEQASIVFKAERDALLAMVSKFHSANGELGQLMQYSSARPILSAISDPMEVVHNSNNNVVHEDIRTASMVIPIKIADETANKILQATTQRYHDMTALQQQKPSNAVVNKQMSSSNGNSSSSNSNSSCSIIHQQENNIVQGRKLQYTPPVTVTVESNNYPSTVNTDTTMITTITQKETPLIANQINVPNINTHNLYYEKNVDDNSNNDLDTLHDKESSSIINIHKEYEADTDSYVEEDDEEEDMEAYPETISSSVLNIEPRQIEIYDDDNLTNNPKDCLQTKQLDMALYTTTGCSTADALPISRIVKYSKKVNGNKHILNKKNIIEKAGKNLTASLVVGKHSKAIYTNTNKSSKAVHTIKNRNSNKEIEVNDTHKIQNKINTIPSKQSNHPKSQLYASTKSFEKKTKISIDSSLKELKFDTNTDIDNSYTSQNITKSSKQTVKVIVPRSYTLRDSDKSWTSMQNNSNKQSYELGDKTSNDNNISQYANIIIPTISTKTTAATSTVTNQVSKVLSPSTIFNDSDCDSIEQNSINNEQHSINEGGFININHNNDTTYIRLKETMNELYKSTESLLSSTESFHMNNAKINNLHPNKNEASYVEPSRTTSEGDCNNNLTLYPIDQHKDDKSISSSIISVNNSIEFIPSTIYSESYNSSKSLISPEPYYPSNEEDHPLLNELIVDTHSQKHILSKGIAQLLQNNNNHHSKIDKSNKQIKILKNRKKLLISNKSFDDNKIIHTSGSISRHTSINTNKINIVTPSNKNSNSSIDKLRNNSIVIPTSYSSSILHTTIDPSSIVYPKIKKLNLTVRTSKTDPILGNNHINKKKFRKI